MLSNFHKNVLGTLSFDAKFPTMRKSQDFITYAIKDPSRVMIQSDTRIGTIDLNTGWVSLSRPHPNGAYTVHLAESQRTVLLSTRELEELKAQIRATSGACVGESFVKVDNSMAEHA
jgi:hypothetical protein